MYRDLCSRWQVYNTELHVLLLYFCFLVGKLM